MKSIRELPTPLPPHAFEKASELEARTQRAVVWAGLVSTLALFGAHVGLLYLVSDFEHSPASSALFAVQLIVPLLCYSVLSSWQNAELEPETDSGRLVRIAKASAYLPRVAWLMNSIRERAHPLTRAEARWLDESSFEESQQFEQKTLGVPAQDPLLDPPSRTR